MKKYNLFLVLVTSVILSIFTSCSGGNEEENPLADSLSGVNNELNGQLTEKEKAIQQFVNTFNDIQANLNEIKEKEKIIVTSTKTGDVKSKEEQIKEDIQAIYELMGKNKSKINSLNKKLKTAKSKITGLEQLIANLEAQLNEKDLQITDLKNQIEQLNIELSNLNLNYEDLALKYNEVSEEVDVKTTKLNTAYYVVGTSKELKENGVITKEGGFIGIGKSAQLKQDFNKDYFTKVDITNFSKLPIASKKAKIITTHPSSSYKLNGEKTIESLEINNSEDFWSTSKYLVIVVEN
jgi:predicted  nucleic acid-binding Zn-ribbon protein